MNNFVNNFQFIKNLLIFVLRISIKKILRLTEDQLKRFVRKKINVDSGSKQPGLFQQSYLYAY